MSAAEDVYRAYRALDLSEGNAARLFAREYLAPALARAPKGRILEVGAGTGATMRALEQAGYRVEGVDVSPSQVEEAARLGTVVAKCDGLTALRREQSGSFAAIIALDVLEHLEGAELLDWTGAVAEKLCPGGLFVVRVPNGEGLFGASIRYGDLTHRRAFTQRSLRQLFALRGLEPEQVRPCRPIVHGPASAFRAAAWWCVEGLIKVANLAESGRADVIVTRNVFAIAAKRG